MKNFKLFESKKSIMYDKLFYACQNDDLNKVKDLIENFGLDVNIRDDDYNTPLYIASVRGNLNIVKYLYKNGADINLRNGVGYTALNAASYFCKIDIMKFLVKNGADVNTQNDAGYTPLHCATINKCKHGIIFLLENGADIDVLDNGDNSPMKYGKIVWSTKEIQELLIKQNPFNMSILKKNGIPIHPDIKEEHEDLDLGSDLGTI